ncbi:MAG: uncharacterized protein QOF48_3263 [Verrucomicrobiota bacterium]|jgi:uncharacterized protein (TIGR01777 family)
MNILVTGASGLVGSPISAALQSDGHHIEKLRRQEGAAPVWNPNAGTIDLGSSPAFDAVIHLAGENVGKRWTAERKRRIRDSRVAGTHLLSETLAKLATPPRVLICASATGFYGDRGEEWLDESSPAGAGFLAGVCRDWESAAAPAVSAGIRVVHLRFGIVLAGQGGALAKMLPAFRLGLGGRLGDGRQYWSWIAIEDVVHAVRHVLENQELRGAVNVTSPNPVTNREFTAALGRVLKRPTFFVVPRRVVSLLFGEMGREALLSSARVRPGKLLASGFRFCSADLDAALARALG